MTLQNLINGEWRPALSGKTYENRNPANPDDLISQCPASAPEDVQQAVEAAKRAFDSWRLMPAPRRAEILFRAGQLLIERKESIAREMTREMGKVVAEARGDVQEAIDMAFYAAGEGRRLFGQTTPSELQNKFAMTIRQPLGVCGLITPWNFPMAIPSWKIFPALVAGNTIVIKPASDTPISCLRLVEALQDAGLPPGVLNLVFGGGGPVGNALIEHPDVRLISFTGSCEVGRQVNERCAPTFKRVSLEMGGKNAAIIMNDANLDLAVEGLVWGAFGTSGQRCTATSRIIVQRGIHNELRERLVSRINKLKLGYGLDQGIDVGPVVNERAMDKILEYIHYGQTHGLDMLTGGGRDTEAGSGWFIKPTLFDNVSADHKLAQEEIFGPVTCIIPVEDLDEAIRVANGIEFGLSTAIYTRDVNASFRAMRDLDAGITYVNAPTIGAEVHLPFGGTKNTGNGHREAAETGLDIFTEWKTLYIDYSDRLQRAQIDNA
jgi:aldehyde dehydrogenase (NAD+)